MSYKLIELVRIYNVGQDTIIDFLKRQGYRNLTKSSICDESIIILLEEEFKKDREKRGNEFPKPKAEKKVKSKPDHVTPNEFSLEVIKLNHGMFSRNKQLIQYSKFPEFNSYFTDLEVENLCKKMSSSYTRRLCKELHDIRKDRKKFYMNCITLREKRFIPLEVKCLHLSII